jgi:hypothetical protein
MFCITSYPLYSHVITYYVTGTSTMLRRLFADLLALRDASTEIVQSQMSVVPISDFSWVILEYCNGHTPVCHDHSFSSANVSSDLLRMPRRVQPGRFHQPAM